MRPLAIDLFCGLGGWTEGLLAEGYSVVGFDIERHSYGGARYPAQLVIQDVRTLHGSQFKDAALIVASPPCQKYSYMAMPWQRSKALAVYYREAPERQIELNELFNACFRIHREACEAAGRHIPLIVENVRGAQPWVGRARWNFGSFYLWGDVPALMPVIVPPAKNPGADWNRYRQSSEVSPHWTVEVGHKQRGSGAAWFDKALDERRKEATAIKNGKDWFGSGADCSAQRRHGSRLTGRKAASALIAKIPLPLSRHIAAVYKPATAQPSFQDACAG